MLLLVGALSSNAGCASENAARKPCPSETWVGECKLRDLRKVEERELPMPYVVLEAIYAPETNAAYPQFTPAETHLRFGTRAAQEMALVDHLKQQALVMCHWVAAPMSCLPGELTADVKPFDPELAPAAATPRIVGCAAIDAASEQDRIARTRSEGSAIGEYFTFGDGSSALSPDASNSAREIAKRMADDPNLECLGLIGQTAPGEPISLAEARARAVKQLLVSLGVDSRRLQTIAANASVTSAVVNAAPAIDPQNRRVSVRVMLQTSAKPTP